MVPRLDLRVRDVRQRLVEERQVARGQGIALEAPITRQRADAHALPAAFLDAGASGQGIDVDQQSRLRQPEIHCRNKALPTGEKSCFVAVLGFQLQRLFEAPRGDIAEGCGLHIARGYQKGGSAKAREYGKGRRDESKYSQEGARLIKPLTIEGNWRAQYSAILNRGWALLRRARLPNSFGSTAPRN